MQWNCNGILLAEVSLQVKKLCTRGVWRMEAPKWEGLIKNVWIYWLFSNVDTWQAKVILHFRTRKYHQYKHFLLNSAVSSSTAAKQMRPPLVTASSEELLGRHCRENTAQQTRLVWCQSREQRKAMLWPDRAATCIWLTLALLSTVSATKFRADISLPYNRPTHLGREQTWMGCSDTHVSISCNGRCPRASSCYSCPNATWLVGCW